MNFNKEQKLPGSENRSERTWFMSALVWEKVPLLMALDQAIFP